MGGGPVDGPSLFGVPGFVSLPTSRASSGAANLRAHSSVGSVLYVAGVFSVSILASATGPRTLGSGLSFSAGYVGFGPIPARIRVVIYFEFSFWL